MKKKNFLLILVLSIILVAILISTLAFSDTLDKTVTENVFHQLSLVSGQCSISASSFLSEQMGTLKGIANQLGKLDRLDDEVSRRILDAFAASKEYKHVYVNFPDGSSVAHTGERVDDVSDRAFFVRSMQGESCVIAPSAGILDPETPVMILSTPIQKDGQTIASLTATYSLSELNRLFNLSLFRGSGTVFVTNEQGEVVATPTLGWMYEGNQQFLQNLLVDHMPSDSTPGINLTENLNGEPLYINITAMPDNGWHIVSIVPSTVVQEQSGYIKTSVFHLLLVIILCIAILFVFIIVVQVSARNHAQLNAKCFKALANQTNKIILEWDFSDRIISTTSNFKQLFGRDAFTQTSAADAISAGAIHPDDHDLFERVFKKILSGESITDVTFRILDADGLYHWCLLSAVVIKDRKGKPYRVIGSLESIDRQVKKEEELRMKAQTDQLTGLYNKATTEYLIRELLDDEEAQMHALMLIDVDNFKNINDKLGHLRGDIVLTQLADLLKHIFREEDVVGRAGGDEFFVLLRNYKTVDLVQRKAAEVCNAFRKDYSENDTAVSISASVGIALFPKHGHEFDDLYQKTDHALYLVKSQGKNHYEIYNNGASAVYESYRTAIDDHGRQQKSFKDHRIEYVFRMLYESTNPKSAIESVLQLIAEHFEFSRVNVYTPNESYSSVSSTFEWCASGFSSIMDSQQEIPMESCNELFDTIIAQGGIHSMRVADLAPEKRIFCEQLGIKSLVYFIFLDQNKVIGCITFHDCVHDYLHTTRDEMDDIRTICQVLSTFLKKQTVQDMEQQHHVAIENVIDHLSSFAYVISRSDYTVLFENKAVVAQVGQSSLGKKCHRSYRNLDAPCPDCPMQYLSDTVPRYTTTIHNSVFDLYVHTDATWLHWSNSIRACLISSMDITPYVKGEHDE